MTNIFPVPYDFDFFAFIYFISSKNNFRFSSTIFCCNREVHSFNDLQRDCDLYRQCQPGEFYPHGHANTYARNI